MIGKSPNFLKFTSIILKSEQSVEFPTPHFHFQIAILKYKSYENEMNLTILPPDHFNQGAIGRPPWSPD